MRTTMLAAAAAVLMLLAPVGAAAAADLPSHRSPGGALPADEAAPSLATPSARFVTLGARLAGTAVVTGHVYNYDGTPLGSAPVAWAVPVGDAWESASGTSGPDGLYTFSGLPAADGVGELLVSSPTEPWSIGRYDATWTDPGTTTFDFRPGVITTSITRGGPWGEDWADVWVDAYGSDARSSVAGLSIISGTSDTVVGDTWAMPGTYSTGAVYFYLDEGIEFTTAATVAVGARSAQTISVDESQAQRVMVTRPYWASGKPGSVVKFLHEGYPGAWTLDYFGFSDSPSAYTFRTLGSLVTTGTGTFSKTVTIPSRAPAGYFYYIEAQHREGPLVLDAPFQVCTLKSSKSSVRRGASVRLSGVVPTIGRLFPDTGGRKWITIYKRTRYPSGPPQVWDATRKGWTRVARLRTDRLGRYSKYVTPGRTTWYVVRYEEDELYWEAYTSVLKVRVY
jgi:hypothetical protein